MSEFNRSIYDNDTREQDTRRGEREDSERMKREEREDVGRGEREDIGRGDREDVGRGEREDIGRGDREDYGRGEFENIGRGDREDVGRGMHAQVVGGNEDINMFLDTRHASAGKIVKLKDRTEFYATGNEIQAKYALIMIPDTMGWNSGRIRNIADYFGANGFFSVIPRLSANPAEGEGKGLFQSSGLGDYMKGITFEGNIKPKIASILDYFQSGDFDKIVVLGFSWGGWIVANILASPDLVNHFICGVIAHPSINLEERMYGGSMIELFSRIQRPLLLFPAKDDPKDYHYLIKLLAYKYPTSECVHAYDHLDHNFLLRGNVDHATIHDACVDILEQTLYYFQYHCCLEQEEYIYPAEPKKLFVDLSHVSDMSAQEGAGRKRDMSTSSTSTATSSRVFDEKPREEGEGLGGKMKHWMNKTGDTFKHMGEKIKHAFTPPSSSTSTAHDSTGTSTTTTVGNTSTTTTTAHAPAVY